MPRQDQLDRLAVVLMVLFCAIWGMQQVAIKFGAVGISPLWQAALRSAGATVLVLAWAGLRGIKLFERDGTLRPGLLAGLLFAGEFAMVFIGLEYTSASRGVIFLYTAPFFVALGAIWLLPHERMRRVQWAGMVLAFTGVLVLFGQGLLDASDDTWGGDLMILLGAMFWAATTLTVKASSLSRSTPEKMLIYQLAVSAVVLALLSAVRGEPGVFAPSPGVWLSLALQTVVVATASYLGWFWLIRRYPATRLSAFSFLTPVLGVLAGGLFLGEALTPVVFTALALVGAGIWVGNRPPRRQA